MKIYDALKVFSINQENQIDINLINKTRISLLKKYHPDINSAGLEMSKIINSAYDLLKEYASKGFNNSFSKFEQTEKPFSWDYWKTQNHNGFNDELEKAIQFAKGFNINIDIVGTWLWISGNTYAFKPKNFNSKQEKGKGLFKWNKNKNMYYFHVGTFRKRTKKNFSYSDITSMYGKQTIKEEKEYQKIS